MHKAIFEVFVPGLRKPWPDLFGKRLFTVCYSNLSEKHYGQVGSSLKKVKNLMDKKQLFLTFT